MLVKDEFVCSTYEYAKDSLIVSGMQNSRPIVFAGLEEVKVVESHQPLSYAKQEEEKGEESGQPADTDKIWYERLPGFDLEKYPYLVTTGRSYMTIINVKTCKM